MRAYVRTYVRTYICMYVCVCMYACICICIYVYEWMCVRVCWHNAFLGGRVTWRGTNLGFSELFQISIAHFHRRPYVGGLCTSICKEMFICGYGCGI